MAPAPCFSKSEAAMRMRRRDGDGGCLVGADDGQRAVRHILPQGKSFGSGDGGELELVLARRRRREQEPVTIRDAREDRVGGAGVAEVGAVRSRVVEHAAPWRRLPAVGKEVRRLRLRVGEARTAAWDRSLLAV